MEQSRRRLRILGIDPGSRLVGYGILETTALRPLHPKHFTVCEAGVLRANDKATVLVRIGALHKAMYQLISELKPDICAIESAFFGVNAQSALKLGQARGALLSALARFDIPVVEMAPNQVKKLITGQGHAGKETVSFALKQLLGFDKGRLPHDVSDAVAIALSYGMQMGLAGLVHGAGSSPRPGMAGKP